MFEHYGSGWEFLAQHPRLLKVLVAAECVLVSPAEWSAKQRRLLEQGGRDRF